MVARLNTRLAYDFFCFLRRPPSGKLVAADKCNCVLQLATSYMTKAQTARELQIGQATVYLWRVRNQRDRKTLSVL